MKRNGTTIFNIFLTLFIASVVFNAKDIRLCSIVGGFGWISVAVYEFYIWYKVNEMKGPHAHL